MVMIPEKYKNDWAPLETKKTMVHVTPRKNWEGIQQVGYIEPRDPSPQHWAGMKAVFLFDEDKASTPEAKEKMKAYVQKSGEDLVRLYIQTKNQLFKSISPERPDHVMALNPIPLEEIIKVEEVS